MSRAPRPAPSPPPQLLRHACANREAQLGPHRIGYALSRSRRRSIGFIVDQHGLAVRAPRWVGQDAIDAALQLKSGWILRKLAEQGERLQQLDRHRVHWQDGVELPYLGESLRLELMPSLDGSVRHLLPTDSTHIARLQLRLPVDATTTQIRSAAQSWLQTQARVLFAARCHHYAASLGVQVRSLTLSSARTRWGSASSSGRIRLNWRLIHHPLAAIDYVVVHELAHLHEMNHSPAFWALVRGVLPDYDVQRQRLRDGAAMLLD